MTTTLTRHAKSRMQTRGIRSKSMPLLLKHGEHCSAYDGASALVMTNKQVDQAIADHKQEIRQLEGMRGVKAVMVGGAVITAYRTIPKRRRNRRLHR